MGNSRIANSPALAKIRKFGGVMSGMVMPNLGAFVGWGLMAAIFIPNGWFPNEKLGEMVGPILNYLLPLLIGYTAGYNIHGQRGGVVLHFLVKFLQQPGREWPHDHRPTDHRDF